MFGKTEHFMDSLLMKLRNRGRSQSPVDAAYKGIPGQASASNANQYVFDADALPLRRKVSCRCMFVVLALVFVLFNVAIQLWFWLVPSATGGDEVGGHFGFPGHGPGRRFPHSQSSAQFYANAIKKETRLFSVISLDKEIYAPGDIARVRVNVFNVKDLQPLQSQSDGRNQWMYSGLQMKMKLPSGVTQSVGNLRTDAETGYLVFFGQVPMEERFGGGEYELQIVGQQYPVSIAPSSRKFQLRVASKVNPKLSMQLEFEKNAYAFGDTVVASLKNVKHLSTGSVPSGAKVVVSATVGYTPVYSNNSILLPADGTVKVNFVLAKPASYRPGQSALLSFKVITGDAIQSVSKTLPLVLDSLQIKMFPESGDLVTTKDRPLSNRIYTQAENPRTGEPADMEGSIVEVQPDGSTKKVADIATTHEGRGRSSRFKTYHSRSYKLVVTKPLLENREYPLPKVSSLPKAGIISMETSSFTTGTPIDLTVDGSPGAWKVVLFKDDVALDKKGLVLKGTPQPVSLHPPAEGLGDGVLRVTLFADPETESLPVAERLLFRRPEYYVNVTFTPKTGLHVVPRQHVEVEVKTTAVYLGEQRDVHKKEHPIEAVVGLRVTDLSKLDLVERRKRAPTMSVAKYLERHVAELNDPEAYMRSEEHMDLLLGTQGWRRFAYKNITTFMEEVSADEALTAKRLALLGIPTKYQLPQHRMYANAMPEMMMFAAQPKQMQRGRAIPVMQALAPMDDAVEMEEHDDEADAAVDEPAADEDADVPALIPQRKKIAVGNDLYRIAPRHPHYTRVYAFSSASKGSTTRVKRREFGETIYWNAGIRTKCNGPGGACLAAVSFDVNDLIGTFRLDGDAFAGHLSGAGQADLISSKPVSVDVDLPHRVSVGDEIHLPVLLSMDTPNAQSFRVDLRLADGGPLAFVAPSSHWKTQTKGGLEVTSASALAMSVVVSNKGKSSTRFYVPVRVVPGTKPNATAQVDASALPLGKWLRFNAAESSDSLTRVSEVGSRGFPVVDGRGGMLSSGTAAKASFEVDVPGDVVEGSSVTVSIAVHLSPYGHLLDTVKSLLREPCGCFEQTSSTTYPMVIALRYLIGLTKSQNDPRLLALVSKAQDLLRKGYKRLASYETPSGGFSWFGDAPGHEALTAYGLVQYAEMARPELGLHGLVDTAMIARTKKWLLKQRPGDGNFAQSTRALDSFGRAPQLTTNAYILWSLAKANVVPWTAVEPELRELIKSAKEGKDPYVMALTASILFDYEAFGQRPLAMTLAKSLHSFQDKGTHPGCVSDIHQFETITSSRGNARVIEATALSVLAWLRLARVEPLDDDSALRAAIKCLAESSKAGVYSSTQSTALALEAIVEYMGYISASTPEKGSLRMRLNDRVVHETGLKEAKVLPSVNCTLHVPAVANGKVKVEVELDAEGEFKVPFTISSELYADTPASSRAEVGLDTKLAKPTVVEGDVLGMNITVRNLNQSASVPMTIAKVGLPAGVEVRMEKLSEMKKTKVFDFFEVFPSYVTFYWLGLKAKQVVNFPLELNAKVPGEYTSPASRVYLYYANEDKVFVKGEPLVIKPHDIDHLLKE